MNKNKKTMLILSSSALLVPAIAAISAKCKNDEVPNTKTEEQIKQELNELAKNLDINIDSTKYTIEEALDINKYTFTLAKEYKLEANIVKKGTDKVELTYTIKSIKDNISSNPYKKEFSNFVNPHTETEQEKINRIARNLSITLDKKFGIDDALSISNYKYTLEHPYKLKATITKKSSTIIVLKYKIIKPGTPKIESEEIEKEFLFEIKNLGEWKDTPAEVNGLNFDKYSALGSFYNINNKMTVSEALEILKNNKTSGNIKVYNVVFEQYDESNGNLKLKFDLEIEGNKINTGLVSISGFKKIEALDITLINVEIDRDKLIKEKKQISDIENNNLSEYLKLITKDETNQNVNILDLTKKYPNNYVVIKAITFTNNKKEKVNFEIETRYKKKTSAAQAEEVVVKKIDGIAKEILKSKIEVQEILNYIIDNEIEEKDIENKQDKYASSYLYRNRILDQIASDFVVNKKQDYWDNGSRAIEFVTQENWFKIDDNLGKIELTFNLKVTIDGKTHLSKYRTFEFLGFKKLDEKIVDEFQLTFNQNANNAKNFFEKIKAEYKKNPGQGFTLDKNWVGTNLMFGYEKQFLRTVGVHPHNKLEYQKSSILTLNLGGETVENAIQNNTQLKGPGARSEFEIVNLYAYFKNITIESIESNRVYFKLNYDLRININSHTKPFVEKEQSVSWYFNLP
ncbi:hypothetical protein OF363_01280 [Mycoplasma enhydrae]|uniref:hypothetical protein n=1 Tax=Mycoplasma enhydrae TaxID=2499220 RepID=UPI0021E9AA62|nr:hypothetical protein [Mycoplasma enhydrae]MCV3733665.1 hypothetical protein [Mycoplasma enhydrae]